MPPFGKTVFSKHLEIMMWYSLRIGLGSGLAVGEGAEAKGTIEVSPRAIASIARRAAMESYGVVGLSRRLRQGLLQMLRRKKNRKLVLPGIEIAYENRSIVIDLFVVVEYGTRISEVAANMAQSVHFAVERALGLPVVQVNVNIQGMRVSRGSI